MRLFLIGWAENRKELVNVAQSLRQDHAIVYWTRSSLDFSLQESLFPGTIFHDYEDAVAARPAPALADEVFLPPSMELLKDLYETESLILTMMNKKYDWMSVAERKHRYYSYVRYWYGVIQKYKPDVIIFSFIPHTLYNFVLFGLAKLLNIPTIMLDNTLVGDRLLFMNDYDVGNTALQNELVKNQNKNFSINDLRTDLQKYYTAQIDPGGDTPPLYQTKELNNFSWSKKITAKTTIIWKSIKDRTILEKGLGYLSKQLHANLADEYNRFQTTPDLTKPFVYAPLQYQPECTTSPLGGIFVDQILMIETLAAALPKGWVIYVKEHPIQWLSRGTNFVGSRYQGYYEALARIKNVFLVPITTNSFRLIREARATATVTGTTGWQALLREKPALIFGYPWYQQCPGLFKVTDVESCTQAFAAIEREPIVPAQKIINFLYAFDQISVSGFVDAYGRETSSVSETENEHNVLQALHQEINKLYARS